MATRTLYNELGQLNPTLQNEFDSIYQESIKIWDEQYLRQFTTHGKEHTAQVEKNLDSLTRPLQISDETKLKAEEIFVLLSACCLHDIGMQLADDPNARSSHAEYAYQLILYSHATIDLEERRVTLPINDSNAREAIALLARAHWTDYAVQLPSEDFIGGGERGRLQLLGALLATADLLDISPVRARYYRSVHRLYDLSPLSDLHQKMHSLVRGFQIVTANPSSSRDLQFQLEWRDNNEIVRNLNEWIMKWFDSQWRLLEPVLYKESGGVIRWHKPHWAIVKFNSPAGPMPTLSPESVNILKAEMTEQQRINRDGFVNDFKTALEQKQKRLFRLPKDSGYDGRMISEWCEARAKLYENCLVARVDIQPSAPMELSSIIAGVMEQWGQHLPTCNDEEALSQLKRFISENQNRQLVSIIVSEDYDDDRLRPLLTVLLHASEINLPASKICLLLTRGAAGPDALDGASVTIFNLESFNQNDIVRYLQSRLGYNDSESQEIYRRLSGIGFAGKPGQIYNYLDMHCGIAATLAYLD